MRKLMLCAALALVSCGDSGPVGDEGSPCSSALNDCPSGMLCVTARINGQLAPSRCARICTDNAQCQSGCCGGILGNDDRTCADPALCI